MCFDNVPQGCKLGIVTRAGNGAATATASDPLVMTLEQARFHEPTTLQVRFEPEGAPPPGLHVSSLVVRCTNEYDLSPEGQPVPRVVRVPILVDVAPECAGPEINTGIALSTEATNVAAAGVRRRASASELLEGFFAKGLHASVVFHANTSSPIHPYERAAAMPLCIVEDLAKTKEEQPDTQPDADSMRRLVVTFIQGSEFVNHTAAIGELTEKIDAVQEDAIASALVWLETPAGELSPGSHVLMSVYRLLLADSKNGPATVSEKNLRICTSLLAGIGCDSNRARPQNLDRFCKILEAGIGAEGTTITERCTVSKLVQQALASLMSVETSEVGRSFFSATALEVLQQLQDAHCSDRTESERVLEALVKIINTCRSSVNADWKTHLTFLHELVQTFRSGGEPGMSTVARLLRCGAGLTQHDEASTFASTVFESSVAELFPELLSMTGQWAERHLERAEYEKYQAVQSSILDALRSKEYQLQTSRRIIAKIFEGATVSGGAMAAQALGHWLPCSHHQQGTPDKMLQAFKQILEFGFRDCCTSLSDAQDAVWTTFIEILDEEIGAMFLQDYTDRSERKSEVEKILQKYNLTRNEASVGAIVTSIKVFGRSVSQKKHKHALLAAVTVLKEVATGITDHESFKPRHEALTAMICEVREGGKVPSQRLLAASCECVSAFVDHTTKRNAFRFLAQSFNHGLGDLDSFKLAKVTLAAVSRNQSNKKLHDIWDELESAIHSDNGVNVLRKIANMKDFTEAESETQKHAAFWVELFDKCAAEPGKTVEILKSVLEEGDAMTALASSSSGPAQVSRSFVAEEVLRLGSSFGQAMRATSDEGDFLSTAFEHIDEFARVVNMARAYGFPRQVVHGLKAAICSCCAKCNFAKVTAQYLRLLAFSEMNKLSPAKMGNQVCREQKDEQQAAESLVHDPSIVEKNLSDLLQAEQITQDSITPARSFDDAASDDEALMNLNADLGGSSNGHAVPQSADDEGNAQQSPQDQLQPEPDDEAAHDASGTADAGTADAAGPRDDTANSVAMEPDVEPEDNNIQNPAQEKDRLSLEVDDLGKKLLAIAQDFGVDGADSLMNLSLRPGKILSIEAILKHVASLTSLPEVCSEKFFRTCELSRTGVDLEFLPAKMVQCCINVIFLFDLIVSQLQRGGGQEALIRMLREKKSGLTKNLRVFPTTKDAVGQHFSIELKEALQYVAGDSLTQKGWNGEETVFAQGDAQNTAAGFDAAPQTARGTEHVADSLHTGFELADLAELDDYKCGDADEDDIDFQEQPHDAGNDALDLAEGNTLGAVVKGMKLEFDFQDDDGNIGDSATAARRAGAENPGDRANQQLQHRSAGGDTNHLRRLIDNLANQKKMKRGARGGAAGAPPAAVAGMGESDDLQLGTYDDLARDADVDKIHSKAMDLNWSRERLQKEAQKMDFSEYYKKAKKTTREKNPAQIPDVLRLQAAREKTEKYTYEALAQSGPLGKFSRRLYSMARQQFQEMYQQSGAELPKFEWLLLLDNSGSFIRFANQAAEAFVVLQETLRKLECRTAVGRLGNQKNQRLLKDFDESFSALVGQRILESFSYDESSHLASGLWALTKKVWGGKEKPSNVHRVCLMITDGLSQELHNEQNWTGLWEKYNVHMLFVTIRDKKTAGQMSEIQEMMKRVGILSKFLDHDESDALPQLLGDHMIKVFSKILKEMRPRNKKVGKTNSKTDEAEADATTEKESELEFCETQTPDFDSSTFLRELPSVLGKLNLADALKKKSDEVTLLYEASSPGAAIPFADSARGMLTASSTGSSGSSTATDSAKMLQYSMDFYARSSSAVPELLAKAGESWSQAMHMLREPVEQMKTILEADILPENTSTRHRRDVKGPTLHMQGLARAIATDFNDKKFFSNKSAGGRAKYMVSILIDVSQSMDGAGSFAVIEAATMLIGALLEMRLDTFSIAVFGEKFRLVKNFDQSWDRAAMFSFLHHLRFDQDCASLDANAIDASVDLFDAAGVSLRVPRKLFVLTDGYGSCGLKLSQALLRAQDEGVEVVGIGLGLERLFVQKCYGKWVLATVPSELPAALQTLYTQDPDASADSKTEDPSWQGRELDNKGSYSTTDGIWRDFDTKKVFTGYLDQLRGEREAKLVRGNAPSVITIDLCFVLDTTGSMTPWMEAVKTQAEVIGTKVVDKIKEKHEGLDMEMKLAVVPYKDFGDQDHLAPRTILDFTSDHELFKTRVRGLRASGGGDEPEDVAGGLHTALEKLSWSSKIRFLVLVTDAPGHGQELHPASVNDDHLNHNQRGRRMETIMQRMREKQIEFLFCRLKKEATKMMEDAMRVWYETKEDRERRMTAVDMFDTAVADRFHVVFVLDASHSMTWPDPNTGVTPWIELMQAYQGYLQKRNANQGLQDLVSVVTFSNQVQTHFEACRLSQAMRTQVACSGGGTCFSLGLNAAREILQRNSRTGCQSLVVFMSDGANHHTDESDANQAARQLGFVNGVHYVAFGKDASRDRLTQLANLSKGTFHAAAQGADLLRVFTAIAANADRMTDEMIQKFGKRMADMVVNKLIIDHM
ncbi:unnamed protein product [Amoebophrya sp. A120]|nr:unnamed protein product [Amoebophrya sp. A120]|eukprot:GSA120T00003465001.1